MVGGDTFSPLAPVLGLLTKKLAKSPSSTVHGGQCDANEGRDIRVDSARGIRGGNNFRRVT